MEANFNNNRRQDQLDYNKQGLRFIVTPVNMNWATLFFFIFLSPFN